MVEIGWHRCPNNREESFFHDPLALANKSAISLETNMNIAIIGYGNMGFACAAS